VQSPDRLASGAKLVILIEEFQENGVGVVFLKGAVEDTPEGKLLLHMQEQLAEYERTKIAERTRRGKLYWARQGVMVGGHTPYGYRFVRRIDSHRARLKVDEHKASIIRAMYQWLVEESLSLRGIAKRLTERGVPTARSAAIWQPTAVGRMIRNPVYKGTFYYQRAESVIPSTRLNTDVYRQAKKTGRRPRPKEEWIGIPVPVIVDETLWEEAQKQLVQNAVYSGRNNKRHKYLLRSLIRCRECGSTYSGQASDRRRYYRCTNKHSAESITGDRCPSRSVRADPIEEAVWSAVSDALRQPDLLVAQYRHRLAQGSSRKELEAERKQIDMELRRIEAQEDRVTAAYVGEVMELDRYKREMDKLRGRRAELEAATEETERRVRREEDGQNALQHIERFCHKISRGLQRLTLEERQQLLRLVVERVTLIDGRVRVETIIPVDRDDDRLRTLRGEPFGRLRTGSVEPRLFWGPFDRLRSGGDGPVGASPARRRRPAPPGPCSPGREAGCPGTGGRTR
jgi:site-specific DNA recombinase